jgi:predicted metal-dependent peptidase
MRAADAKLRAARTRLILDKPFIGALVLHLPLVPRLDCASVATDARSLYFNPRYVGSLSLAQTQFVLAHEALHCALGHFARCMHRARKQWDIACDHAVNLLLIDEGLAPPEGVLANAAFRGLCAEEIYPLIEEDSIASTLDDHQFTAGGSAPQGTVRHRARGGARDKLDDAADVAQDDACAESWSDAGSYGRPGSTPAVEQIIDDGALQESLAQQWQMRLASAAQQALRAGRLSASWQRLMGQLIEPRLSWRALLTRYLLTIARDDYSFQRPPRRESDAILPRLSSHQTELVIALDTSGSIGERELRAFAAEVSSLQAEVRARVTIHACDDKLAQEGPWTFEPWQPVVLPERISGGGMTSFVPVFEWVRAHGQRPDALVYFSDADGEFPNEAPPYPVIWVVKGKNDVPWGERIQLND